MTKMVTGTYDEEGNRTTRVCPRSIIDPGHRCGASVDLGDELDIEVAAAITRELTVELREYVLLVHPREGETVVDALRRHFAEASAGTVTVATADGPRNVGVPLVLGGMPVFESTLIPVGEVRLAPQGIPASAIRALKITVQS